MIGRDLFKNTLQRYGYMSFREKTKVYKDLNFILHDENNYTLPVKDKVLNKTVRKVVFNYTTYLTIKNLYSKKINR